MVEQHSGIKFSEQELFDIAKPIAAIQGFHLYRPFASSRFCPPVDILCLSLLTSQLF